MTTAQAAQLGEALRQVLRWMPQTEEGMSHLHPQQREAVCEARELLDSLVSRGR